MRSGMTLISGFTKPIQCFRIILRNAHTFDVHTTDYVLRVSKILISRFAIPLHSLNRVLHHT